MFWIQSLLSGGVYAKDFQCLYGPMLIYPLLWVMNIFGETVLVERYFKYVLDSAAFLIIIFFLFRTLRWNAMFLVSSILYILTFYTYYTSDVSVNGTELRVALGILPLLLAYQSNGKRYHLLGAGVIAGQSLLFSQEVGICSVLSVIAFSIVDNLVERNWRSFIKEIGLLFIGCAASVTPMLIFFSLNGALMPFLTDLYEYPKLVTLGYGSLPFPAFKDFAKNPFSDVLFYYWPILSYMFVSIYLFLLIFMRKIDKGLALRVSLLVFGVLLFRTALGRSDEFHIRFAYAPAFLTLFLSLDKAITGIFKNKERHLRAGSLIIAILIVGFSALLYSQTNIRASISSGLKDLARLHEKFTIADQGYEIPSIERGGIFFDPSTASSIMQMDFFLRSNTSPGDYVYFFPNEAAYYFLFNRNNPTRYSMSYLAVTSAQKRELVAQLEQKKPEYIIYSLRTWRIDGINEDIQVPEVVRYMRKKYGIYRQFEDFLVLKRSAI